MLSHRNLIAGATGVFGTFPNSVTFSHEDSYLSFLPLAHVLEQEVTVMLMTLGARISFFGGDVLKLLDDLADVKPTIFVAVPRLLNRVYSKVLEGVEKSSMLKKWLFNTAFRYKKQLLSNGIITEKSFWDWLVFRKISSKLGGK